MCPQRHQRPLQMKRPSLPAQREVARRILLRRPRRPHNCLSRRHLDHASCLRLAGEISHPEISHPEISHPEICQPEICGPETCHSEISHPEISHQEIRHPESCHPDKTCVLT